MTLLTDEQLLQYNQLGIIPGPSESVEDFVKRADYCLTLKDHLSEELKANLGNMCDTSSTSLPEGFNNISSLYDFSPHWIPIFFSNYQLTPWHGGCAWIFQVSEQSPTAALLQLRQSLRFSPKYMGIYHRDELIRHEIAHVGRMKFDEPQFEEVLAYRTSSSPFRRWFGPVIQSSMESMLFVMVLGLIVFIDVFLLSFDYHQSYFTAMWLKLVPAAMIVWALVRLWTRQKRFDACLLSLTDCLHNPDKARHVIYRLQDHEIVAFAKMDASNITDYAIKNAANSLRWRVIYKHYFLH